MTTKLLLNSTKPSEYTRWAREERWVWCVCVCVCVCSNLYPPCIYRREPRPLTPGTAIRSQWDASMWLAEGSGAHWAISRLGWSASHPVAPTAPNLSLLGLSGPPLVWTLGVEPVLTGFALVLGLHLSIWAWIYALIFSMILCRAKVCLQPAY